VLVSFRFGPGRSSSVGKVGLRETLEELFVVTVPVLDGAFDEYETVLNVSERCTL
jgi:hypothetical protein